MICDTCGKDIQGIMQWADHPCNRKTIVYKVPTDNEMRNKMMELGVPDMAFEAFGYAKPTEMERVIFEERKDDPEDFVFFVGRNSPLL